MSGLEPVLLARQRLHAAKVEIERLRQRVEELEGAGRRATSEVVKACAVLAQLPCDDAAAYRDALVRRDAVMAVVLTLRRAVDPLTAALSPTPAEKTESQS